MTFLEAVNNVLRRLRETEVTSVNDTAYSKMIGVFVNDAKTQVENAYAWNALQTSIIVSTVGGTSDYTLTGSGNRFRVMDVMDDTSNTVLSVVQWPYIARQQRMGTVGNTAPYNYAFNGVDANGDTKVTLWPTPDGVYSIAFTSIVPQAELSSDSTVISVPYLPVVLGAYARAVAERGEDQGFISSEAYGLYKDALSDAIAIESSRTSDDASWTA